MVWCLIYNQFFYVLEKNYGILIIILFSILIGNGQNIFFKWEITFIYWISWPFFLIRCVLLAFYLKAVTMKQLKTKNKLQIFKNSCLRWWVHLFTLMDWWHHTHIKRYFSINWRIHLWKHRDIVHWNTCSNIVLLSVEYIISLLSSTIHVDRQNFFSG